MQYHHMKPCRCLYLATQMTKRMAKITFHCEYRTYAVISHFKFLPINHHVKKRNLCLHDDSDNGSGRGTYSSHQQLWCFILFLLCHAMHYRCWSCDHQWSSPSQGRKEQGIGSLSESSTIAVFILQANKINTVLLCFRLVPRKFMEPNFLPCTGVVRSVIH